MVDLHEVAEVQKVVESVWDDHIGDKEDVDLLDQAGVVEEVEHRDGGDEWDHCCDDELDLTKIQKNLKFVDFVIF